MIPREAGRGRSFLGAGQYYLHDKQADTSERVAFTHTENLPTNDPQKALKWMAWTAINAEEIKRASGATMNGQSCERPVFSFSLAWHPEQEPQQQEMIDAGRAALAALDLHQHEALMVAHTDRPHPHMHVIVNVIDPETGKASSLSFSRKKLSEWAEAHEREHGKIYCDQRVENNARRKEGEYVKYQEPEVNLKSQVTQLYQQSDSGMAFQAGLAELGYTLAQGKRPVLLDENGKIYSLYRQIEGAKSGDIKARLADIGLPDVDDARGRIEESGTQQVEVQPQPEPFDREQQDRDWQDSIVDAAIYADLAKQPKPPPRPPARPQPSSYQLNALQDRHHTELGKFFTETSQAKLKLKYQLDQQYGEDQRQLQSDIAHLDNILRNSGPVRRWWLKATGQIPRDAEADLDNMRRTLGNVEQRQSEARDALDRQTEHQRNAIDTRHQQDRERLAHRERILSDSIQALSPSDEPQHEDHRPSVEY